MISVLMPTRGRAKMWYTNIKKCFETAITKPEFLVYVDEDDPQLALYTSYADTLTGYDIQLIVDKPLRSAKAMKYLAFQAKYEYMIFGTDDLDWKTPGWDKKLIEKMPPHGLAVICPSSAPGKTIKARIPLFTKKWRDITGLWPDDFVHFGPDGYVIKIAQSSGQEINVYDVEILHSKLNDETSKRARSDGKRVDLNAADIKEKAERIKSAIKESGG